MRARKEGGPAEVGPEEVLEEIGPEETERLALRALTLLARPGAWLDTEGAGGRVRLARDRRRRAALEVPDAVVARLAKAPGLLPRAQGGCRLARAVLAAPQPPPGRHGVLEGDQAVMTSSGRRVTRRVNLGESPIAWLARRPGPDGRPFLSPAQAAAGERLRDDFNRAGGAGRLTMAWDAGPRVAGGRAPGLDAAERALHARAKVRAALEAAGPGLREVLERVCLDGSALEAAERDLGLPRRAGKAVLKLALTRLAAFYGRAA